MKRNVLFAVVVVSVIALSGLLVAHAAAGKVLGSSACKMCHSAAAKGNQFAAWQKQGHAKAFTTLTTAKAKEVGAKLGVTDPSTDPKCLKCHTLAGSDPKMGVQCESCHGPGETHKAARMKAGIKPERQAVPGGEIIGKPDAKVCISCHNSQSPTYKPFDYATAVKKITHSDPRSKP